MAVGLSVARHAALRCFAAALLRNLTMCFVRCGGPSRPPAQPARQSPDHDRPAEDRPDRGGRAGATRIRSADIRATGPGRFRPLEVSMRRWISALAVSAALATSAHAADITLLNVS